MGCVQKAIMKNVKRQNARSVFLHIVTASPVDAICSRERPYMIRCGVAFQIRYEVIVTSYRDRAGWRAEVTHMKVYIVSCACKCHCGSISFSATQTPWIQDSASLHNHYLVVDLNTSNPKGRHWGTYCEIDVFFHFVAVIWLNMVDTA